jgi:hypothetical protein
MTAFLWIPETLWGFNDILSLRILIFGARPGMKPHELSMLPNAYSKEKAKIEKRIGALAREQKFSVPGPRYFNYFFVEKDRRRDPGNFAAAARKVIEDALQKTRDEDSVPLLAGDGWKHVLGYVDYWDVCPTHPGVAVAITEDRRMREEEAVTFFEILAACRPNMAP